MKVLAYPVQNKRKSIEICDAFVQGCGGAVAYGSFMDADAYVFYGVDASNEAVWRTVRREKRPFYYIDNAYFDQARERYFRVTRNALQHSGFGLSDGKRFAALGIEMQPWRVGNGGHIVVCPQSDFFMRTIAGVDFDWTRSALSALAMFTDRTIRVREWSRDKAALAATLADDLAGAHALVTWSSAAAVMAVLAGVPIVTMGPCAAAPMAGDLSDVESLPQPARETWAGVLADNQFGLDEMRCGHAWERLR